MIKHRLICFFVSLLVRGFDLVWAALGRGSRVKCVVLNYHGVKPEERRAFSQQMDLVRQLAKPLAADTEALPEEPGTYVVVTFDDALECVLQNALPELEARGIPATIFVVTDTIGKPASWQDMGPSDAAGQRAMTLAQLKSLPIELITIGSHSMTHPLLSSISREQLWHEVKGSREKLEELLQRRIDLFSCPYGVCDLQIIACCREAGYKRVFTGLANLALSEANEFVTGRVRTTLQDTKLEFSLKLLGAYRWLPTVISWKRSLLLRMHRSRKMHAAEGAYISVTKTSNLLERTGPK